MQCTAAIVSLPVLADLMVDVVAVALLTVAILLDIRYTIFIDVSK
jgi:hypothetical protein